LHLSPCAIILTSASLLPCVRSGKSSAQKKPEAAYEAFQDGAGTPANETKEAPSANGFSEHKDSNSLEDDLDDSRIVSSKGAFDEVDDEGDEGDEGAPAGVLADIITAAALASADIVDGDVRRPADDAPVDGGGNEPASENAAAELCFHEGTQAHADGRLDDAIKQFNYAIGLDPTQSHYYHHLAHSLQEGDRLDESVEAYKSMLKIDPGNHDGWYDMGYIQQQLGNAADAAASFSRALELNPVDKDALIFLGMSFMSQGEYPNAIDAYERALEIDPSCVTSHYNLGTAFLNSKPESNRSAEDYHRAGHHFHEAIRVHPDYADAYFNLALCYQGCGEHQDALDTFQHALELEPKMQEAADAINAIQHAMAQEVADRQRKADAARNIAHGQRLLKSPTETGGGLGASSRNIVREETKSNDSPPVVPVLTTKYPAEQAAAAGAAAAPPPRQHEYDKLRRALELERMRAIKLEEQLASQAQVHSAQVAVLRQTQESNDRVKNHRDDLEGFKEAAASRNHAAEVEIRMQKLLANFKTLQTQHEASLRGKQQLQRNHDALLEANRREKATVAELREQTTREQAEMSALRVVSDAQHRELTRLRKVEEEQKTFHQQHSQDQALVQQVQAEKSALVATLASTEKQHRQKVQEMVQAYGESTKRLQLLEQATREDSDAKVVALRTDQTAILSALKAAHAAELDQAKATRAEEGAVALGKLRARQLRSIVQQWIGKKQHRGWNTWKTVYLSQKLRAEFTTTAEALETKHKSASEEMVEGHRVANTRALLEKDRVIADQQVLLEVRCGAVVAHHHVDTCFATSLPVYSLQHDHLQPPSTDTIARERFCIAESPFGARQGCPRAHDARACGCRMELLAPGSGGVACPDGHDE
jgi:tetratricopeptide (TPR) repeat protein